MQRGRRHRLLDPADRTSIRKYAYACCTVREYAVVKHFAIREGLSISDFVRRCINAWLLEEGDDVPLLTEYKQDRVDALRGDHG